MQMKLQNKLSILIISLIVISIGLSSFFVSRWQLVRMEEKVESNLYNVTGIIASTPFIQESLYNKDVDKIQNYVEDQLKFLKDVEIITIADMNGIRYGHPNVDRLGGEFVGGDERKVIETGEIYSSIATGTLGRSVRVFAPVFYNNQQVGFVMSGHLFDDVLTARHNMEKDLIIFTSVGIILGAFGAVVISLNIKKSLMNLEPYEIVQLYREKNAMFQSIREGIIAVDRNGNITLVNDSALKIINYNSNEVIGKNVKDVFPTSKLINVLESGQAEYDRGQKINGAHIMTNRVPIFEGDTIVGALSTFRNRTEVIAMAEEITGVNQIIKALRANTHEFMNKLHVILGLIEMEEYNKAKSYILDLNEHHVIIRKMIFDKISNNMIGALLLGKINRAKEENIELNLTEDSSFKESDYSLNSEVAVILIGNLIENSIESIKKAKKNNGSIDVYLNDVRDEVIIQITDNGIGVENDKLNEIFKRGYTTKSDSNGIGLDLVNSNVKRLGGYIEVESTLGEGTTFTVIIPKEDI
jgi:PAS domain S-box-containing protein